MAGESARDVARRHREKAARLERVAGMYEKGALGEEATAAALSALPSDAWTVVHDMRWPGRRFANIDHIVVGPAGVFVIDAKHWSGSVTVRDNVLRQNGRKREDVVASVADAAIAVTERLHGIDPRVVHPVLCFVDDERTTGWARDVMLCSTATVVEMLTSRPAVLTAEQLLHVHQR